MALTLYLHPLASFCHKVLIALYENGTSFEPRMVDFADPGSAAALIDTWPVGKIPVLHDDTTGQVVPETTIIIEYLHQHYPGPVPLLPEDKDLLQAVRLWDRFYDLYVSQPMQKIVVDRIRPLGEGDKFGVAEARDALKLAYGMIDQQIADKQWAAGEQFSMADCAAFPGLFFANVVEPFGNEQVALNAYFERLLARPSIQRVLEEAKPFFAMFPYRDAMAARFRD